MQYWCGCDFPLNDADNHAAVEALKAQVGSGRTLNENFFAKSATTVAFACSPYGYFITSADDLTKNFADITNTCGYNIAGTVWAETNEDQRSSGHVGYMQLNGDPNQDFCGAATSSKEKKC